MLSLKLNTSTSTSTSTPLFQLLRRPPPIPIPIPKPISLLTSKFVGKTIFRGNISCWETQKTSNSMIKFTQTRVSTSSDDDFVISESSSGSGSGLAVVPAIHVASRLNTIMDRLSKWLATAMFCSIVLAKHDAEGLWLAMGIVSNFLLSSTLKRILNQERPASAMSLGPGMPSSHAQSIFFAVLVTIISVVEWRGLNTSSMILSVLLLALASYLSWLRVLLNYHTSNQVAVGAMVGSIFAIFWFWAWNTFVLKAFHSFLLVQIIVVLGTACFCGCLLLHFFQDWMKVED